MLKHLTSMKLWTVLGALASIGFGLFGAYIAFYWNQPKIEFRVQDHVYILDNKRNIPDIDIIYRGDSISSSETNISIIRLNVLNNGTRDILIDHFDPKIGWGIEIDGGEIVDASIASATNSYLLDNFVISQRDQKLRFPSIIFEKDDFVIIDISIIHKIGQSLDIAPYGKIVGVVWPSVIWAEDNEGASYVSDVIEAPFWTHVQRVSFYFVVLILFLISFLVTAISIDAMTGAIRRRKFNRVIGFVQIDEAERVEFLQEIFLAEGLAGLETLQRTMASEVNVRDAKDFYDKRCNSLSPHLKVALNHQNRQEDGNFDDMSSLSATLGEYWGPESKNFERMKSLKLVAGGARGPVYIDQGFREPLDELILRLS